MNIVKGKNCSNIDKKMHEEYISPDCEVYDLELESMICGTSEVNGEMEEITFGGSAGFPQSSVW